MFQQVQCSRVFVFPLFCCITKFSGPILNKCVAISKGILEPKWWTISVMVILQPQSSLTVDMSEQSREIFVQLLLRNIRQMYYSRAYCEPRLQRFMIRAQPPQPPSQPEPPSRPPASSEPQAPSKPTAEESPAVDEKVDGVRKMLCALNVLSQLWRPA